jgi:hypothetical protein
VEIEEESVSGDKNVATIAMSLRGCEKIFHRICGKACGKLAFQRYKFLKNLDF